ncbi:hypothetical protein [Streptacidiphilus sp. PAMC 29251]
MAQQHTAFSETSHDTHAHGTGLSAEEFAGLRLAVLDELFTGRTRPGPAGKPKAAKLKAAKLKAAKAPKVKERARMVTRPLVAEAVTPPMGTVPGPVDAEPPKPWELSPQQLRVEMDAALWPTDTAGHTWVPRAPVSLSDFLQHGI